jgi:hypothetical protein
MALPARLRYERSRLIRAAKLMTPMNRYERRPTGSGEAEVEFLDGEFRVRRPGAFVRCAVTREPIALEDLRYWDVDRQEAYASPQALLTRRGVKVVL